MIAEALAGLQRTGRRAADLLLPPLCLRCGAAVGEAAGLCAGCWGGVGFLGPPLCACCGHPFEYDPGPDALCAACARARPCYERARAVFRYDDGSRDLVLGFKYADRTDAAPVFGRWLARAGSELLEDADLIVPVPLHWLRLFRRRYNQAALLALALARAAGVPAAPELLKRRRATPSQGRLGRLARRRNVAGAFAAGARQAARIEGRRVLLVDDVLTTGATAEACAAALLRAGAAAVDVLTLARVVRPAA